MDIFERLMTYGRDFTEDLRDAQLEGKGAERHG